MVNHAVGCGDEDGQGHRCDGGFHDIDGDIVVIMW